MRAPEAHPASQPVAQPSAAAQLLLMSRGGGTTGLSRLIDIFAPHCRPEPVGSSSKTFRRPVALSARTLQMGIKTRSPRSAGEPRGRQHSWANWRR